MSLDTLGWLLVVCLVLLNAIELRLLRRDIHDLAEFRAMELRQ